MNITLVAGLLLGMLVYVLLRLKKADQWHHGWLLLAALDLPPWARIACLCIGADDFVNHLVEWFGGPVEHSPLAYLYTKLLPKIFPKLF
jgi:hypothetical protein